MHKETLLKIVPEEYKGALKYYVAAEDILIVFDQVITLKE
jgi:hypothetical protein